MTTKFQPPKPSSADFADYASEMLAGLKRLADDHQMLLLGNLIEFARIEAARNAVQASPRKSRKAA